MSGTEREQGSRSPLRSAFGLLLGFSSLLLLGWSLFAVARVPLGALWLAGLAATAWGHVLAAAALLVAALGAALGHRARVALALAAAALFLTPAARAWLAVPELEAEMDRVFPAASWPVESAKVRMRAGPFDPLDLIGREPEAPEVSRRSYARPGATPLTLLYHPPATSDRGARGPAPVVISVHGGSWRSGAPDELPALHRHLARLGVAVIAPEYRLAPAHPFPAALEDLRAVRAWVAAEAASLRLDASRIVWLGRSAGGQLALLAAYETADPAVRGAIGLYAPTDLAWSARHPGPERIYDTLGTLRDYLGGSLEERPEVYRAASPLALVGPDAPPTLLIHGWQDVLVTPRQATRLARELERSGVPHVELMLPWAVHACDANLRGPGGQATTWAIERFLARVFTP